MFLLYLTRVTIGQFLSSVLRLSSVFHTCSGWLVFRQSFALLNMRILESDKKSFTAEEETAHDSNQTRKLRKQIINTS